MLENQRYIKEELDQCKLELYEAEKREPIEDNSIHFKDLLVSLKDAL